MEGRTRTAQARYFYFEGRAPWRINYRVFFRRLFIIERNGRFSKIYVRKYFMEEACTSRMVICTRIKKGFQDELGQFINGSSVTNAIVRGASSEAIIREPAHRVPRARVNSFTVGVATFRIERYCASLFCFTSDKRLASFVICVFNSVSNSVASIAFNPSFLPRVSNCFNCFVRLFNRFETVIWS